jgi:hypothetical protein
MSGVSFMRPLVVALSIGLMLVAGSCSKSASNTAETGKPDETIASPSRSESGNGAGAADAEARTRPKETDGPTSPSQFPPRPEYTPPRPEDHPLDALSVWNDELAEISYYDAMAFVEGQPRRYVRVMLVNREWMDLETGVRTEATTSRRLPVFQLSIAEEVATESYNHRTQLSVFLARPELSPFKMIVSTQGWAGSSFKHLRWRADEVTIQSFSYAPNEGDRRWQRPTDAYPLEALYLLAREVAAGEQTRYLNLLPPMCSDGPVEPATHPARLDTWDAGEIALPAGRFAARRVTVKWLSPSPQAPESWFIVESVPPYRLLQYKVGPREGSLRHSERRAWWDPASPSGFYKPGEAP